MTRRAWFAALAAAILAPAVTLRLKRHQEGRESYESLRERVRERMRAMGCDPDRMTDDEKMDYVCRAIDECRREQREKAAQSAPG
ncbi:MAG: hypothetical protein JO166_10305 [Deltaproteobacteria bacterium]|nr:hypothetical protein [Deltaproteobacteria bacterium]